jgi:quinolinate synthase
MNLPMLDHAQAPLMLESIPALQDEVRALAQERGAVILAHNYQLPEIQRVADYVGDSLGLSRQAAAADSDTIVFCGVHFMAETASILSPDKTVLIPDPDAGCSLADSITAEQLRDWKAANPGAIVVMFLGAYVEKTLGRKLTVWDGECHVHAGIRPDDINAVRAAHPGADFLVHPECGCSTSVMEYVAAGDVDSDGVHMLSTGGMLTYAAAREVSAGAAERRSRVAIVATEIGMLYPLREAAPDIEFIAANEAASCRYMKMITLPKLRDALRDGRHEVRVDAAIADRARLPIERMIAIG